MAKLKIDNIKKSFGKIDVLKGVNLDVADGEFIVLLGPSGCGKSTLLRIIAGLEEQTSGRLIIGNEEVDQLPPAKRGIAMVFQSYALYPHLDVRGNWALGLKQAGVSREVIEERTREAARILSLEALLDRKPSQMSGGQRQRVAIGRAIVRHPKVFLFDEPLSNLDAALRSQVRFEIARLHRQLGATMIYVTHDQVEAMTLADRIVVMHQGVIQQVGTPEELYRTPANLFVAGFIGSPKMNLLNGQWRGGGRIAIKGGGSVDIDASAPAPANDELVVGVRPDGLSVIDPAGADLHGKVVLNEYLGRETYLHLDLENGSPMIVEISPDLHLRQGDTVGLAVKPGAAHLFAAASEQRLAA
ncbi:MAG TPA: sn-glycerol-3-phosphate ABC transporter ATP-binding protein UgpC [Geminicoccus sp.]|nr:sn-glycerol-3-phosphate ABC transporter ATP-binding protein UgpC [Geminicoccus sp.]